MELIIVKCPNLSNPCEEEECGQTYKKDLNVERCSLYFDYNCAWLGNLPKLPFILLVSKAVYVSSTIF